MPDSALDILQGSTRVALEPTPVELLCGYTKLDDEPAGEVFGFDFTSFLPPKADQSCPYDDAGIRAADKSLRLRAELAGDMVSTSGGVVV